MIRQTAGLHERIAARRPILLAEISPPWGTDPAAVCELAKRYAGKVHALGVTDNRDRVAMSALAAASLIAREGIEPILHVTTRDRNRIALVSEALGAQALGIRNILCTSGRHQTLGRFRAAKNVFDLDAIQLLETYAGLANGCALVGEEGVPEAERLCLGAVAAPDADPPELQLLRLAKKIRAGAEFLVTQPVYDIERFRAWWSEVTGRGMDRQAAILAGIRPLLGEDLARVLDSKRPLPRVPDAVLQQVTAQTDEPQRRRAAIDVALETIGQLADLDGLGGFSISADADHDAALEIIEKSSLGSP